MQRVSRVVQKLWLLAVVALPASGCLEIRAACEGIGVCDKPAPPALTVDVICDSSRGSTCTSEAIGETLDVILREMARRPGSTVRLWALASSVDGVVTVGNVTSPEMPPADGARRAHEELFIKAARAQLVRAAEAAFARPPKQSPIADTIARVLMASSGDADRRLVLISDMREVGRFDFECGPLPSPPTFVKRLKDERVLVQDGLKGVGVAFTYVGVPPVDTRRCPVTIARARAIETLWRELVASAGGTVGRYTDGPVDPSDLSK